MRLSLLPTLVELFQLDARSIISLIWFTNMVLPSLSSACLKPKSAILYLPVAQSFLTFSAKEVENVSSIVDILLSSPIITISSAAFLNTFFFSLSLRVFFVISCSALSSPTSFFLPGSEGAASVVFSPHLSVFLVTPCILFFIRLNI